MNVRNCKKCGKLFNYISGMPICPDCKAASEKVFQEVKEFIRENPRADIKDIAKTCNVEIGQIQQWIREERLEFTEDSPVKIQCENCGELIRSGKYCNKCKDKMVKNLNGAIDKPEAPAAPEHEKKLDNSNKMRFLGH